MTDAEKNTKLHQIISICNDLSVTSNTIMAASLNQINALCNTMLSVKLDAPVSVVDETPTSVTDLHSVLSGGMGPVLIRTAGNTIVFRPGYIVRRFQQGLEYAAARANEEYPDRTAKKLEIVMACPARGETYSDSGHGSSGPYAWLEADIHYWTYGATNHTERGTAGEPLIEIWDGDTLTDLFDCVRNLAFIARIRSIFPDATAVVDNIIKIAIGASKLDFVLGDSPFGSRQHHTHMHIRWPGKKINYEEKL